MSGNVPISELLGLKHAGYAGYHPRAFFLVIRTFLHMFMTFIHSDMRIGSGRPRVLYHLSVNCILHHFAQREKGNFFPICDRVDTFHFVKYWLLYLY